MNSFRSIASVVVACALFGAGVTKLHGYMVGPALSLDQLAETAEVIFKGTVISSEAVVDGSFKDIGGYGPRETKFKVISTIKGAATGETVAFRHYDEKAGAMAIMFQPQYYHFETGRTYVVFARRDDGARLRQLWQDHKSKNDQGVLWCLDDKPAPTASVKEVFWRELGAMLKSTNAQQVLYAIRQLDEMSVSFRNRGLNDFAREQVLAAIQPLIASGDVEVSQAALKTVGSHNPYLDEGQAPFWLNTVGRGEITGLGKMEPGTKNVGGKLYWRELVSVANEHGADEVKATAIRALGLVRESALGREVDGWLTNKAESVRASAALLLADYPELLQRIASVSGDTSVTVRAHAAYAIGFGQYVGMQEFLGKLLRDSNAQVRRAAAMSLLSFDPAEANVRRTMAEQLANEEFRPLFLNAIAKQAPGPYLDELARAISEKWSPTNWWGGQIPAFTSWNILFRHVQKQPASALQSGGLDRYLDVIEMVGNYGSSQPRDIYALYVQRGLKERATAYREKAKKSHSYDIDYYFKQVDAHPSHYLTE